MPCRLSITLIGPFLATGINACTPAASTQDDAIRTVRIYDLLRAYPRAVLNVQNPRYVSRDGFSVNDEVRPGVFLQSAGSVVFPPVRVSPESVLTFKIGLIDTAWDQSDGVQFQVTVLRMSGAATEVFSRFLDPKHNADDRRWIDEKVSLRQFGDQDVRVILATLPGPAGDYTCDWGVFAEPQIVLGPAK